MPNAYYGLALLYRMAGKFDDSKSVLETMFVRIPQQTLAREYAGIYAEAKNLYSELSKGTYGSENGTESHPRKCEE